MERYLYQELLTWKTSSRRKPLILRGARQTGKTYLLKRFAAQEYKNFVYLDFEEDPALMNLFASNLKPTTILQALHAYFEQEIFPEKTLIIFDEIQACPNALNSLKYFNEQANEFHIIAAGSLLGIKLANTKSFPVGKVNFLQLYPLCFREFLDAIGRNKLRTYLDEMQQIDPLPETLHQDLMRLLKLYIFVGGMPEAVACFKANEQQLSEVRKVHKEILQAYVLDFAKHAPGNQVMKITTIWNVIANQLAKENKKFIFSAIDKSARAREYETAIQWLSDAGLIYLAYNVSVPKMPLNAYCDKKTFKVYLLDIGLLGAMSNIHPRIILEGDRLFTEYKGACAENFVAQELVYNNKELYYWTSAGMAEVDFLLAFDDHILPLEVKAGLSRRKKSLQIYNQKYHPNMLLRASLLNLKQDGMVRNYPLYMIGNLS